MPGLQGMTAEWMTDRAGVWVPPFHFAGRNGGDAGLKTVIGCSSVEVDDLVVAVLEEAEGHDVTHRPAGAVRVVDVDDHRHRGAAAVRAHREVTRLQLLEVSHEAAAHAG